MKEQKIAVIGFGLWGRNIVRNFYNLNVLEMVCDLEDESLKTVQARVLTELAESKNLVVMVDHLLLYHPAVNRLRMLIEEGVLGELLYAQSDRLNVNYHKNDRSVMWDLAPHDVSMISYVTGKKPLKVISATGCSSDRNNIMDITHIDIEFEGGMIGHISDSWITPQKHVTLLVRGTKATAMFDDTAQTDKLRVYDNYIPANTQNYPLDYLEIEPLKLACQHFVNCCATGHKARSDGENGYTVVSILEEAEKLMLGAKVEELNNKDFALSRMKV